MKAFDRDAFVSLMWWSCTGLGSTPKSVGREILEKEASIKCPAFGQYTQTVVFKVEIPVRLL